MTFKLRSSGPFKMMGSSPAKDMPHETNGIPPSKAAMMNKRHADAEHPHDLEPESPAKQELKAESKQIKKKLIGPIDDPNKFVYSPIVVPKSETKEHSDSNPGKPAYPNKPKNKSDEGETMGPKKREVPTPPVHEVTHPKKTKKKVSKGDVIQTLLIPRANIKKTLKVVKHYTPPKVKQKIKSVISKGKSLYSKARKYLKSDA